jgi:hypothetical protein
VGRNLDGFPQSDFAVQALSRNNLTGDIVVYTAVLSQDSFDGYIFDDSGAYAHAEGLDTIASGETSHAEGAQNTASGYSSHAEGIGTIASGEGSHAEGANNTTASGDVSHAEGGNTTASGAYSHAEGASATASGAASHAEGSVTVASGYASHAEGNNSMALGADSHAEGAYNTASGNISHAENSSNIASGNYSHAEGSSNFAAGNVSHVEGGGNVVGQPVPIVSYDPETRTLVIATGYEAYVQLYGAGTYIPYNMNAFEGGYYRGAALVQSKDYFSNIIVLAPDQSLPSEFCDNGFVYSYYQAGAGNNFGTYSHAEGGQNIVSGMYSHGEGYGNVASGSVSHAEGSNTIAAGSNSHAEGFNTTASRQSSHAAGSYAAAAHDRTWIWKGSTATDVISTTRTDQFMVSAAGGVYIPGNVGIGTDANDQALTVVGTISTNNHNNSSSWAGFRSTQTSNFSAYPGSYYIVNTTSTPITGALPVAPTIGTTITFQDSFIQWQTNNFTINRNGNMIQGLNENMICDRGGVMFDITYIGGSIGWRVN